MQQNADATKYRETGNFCHYSALDELIQNPYTYCKGSDMLKLNVFQL